MNSMDKNILSIKDKPWLLSLICTIFVIYPNASWLWCELTFPMFHDRSLYFYIVLFVARFVFYWLFVWLLLRINLKFQKKLSLSNRMLKSLVISAIGLLLYIALSFLTETMDMPNTLVVMQFLTSGLICAMLGYIFELFEYQRSKEQEIEQLKIENLESRLKALTNQINPHFFFNSLNGVSALVRKGDDEKTLSYVNNLSDIFRYILQSEKRGLVTLQEELDFLDAFSQVMEVRYGDKLKFNIEVPEDQRVLKLPVLSLLPLIENVVEHNTIDSEHPMTVHIGMSAPKELMVWNALCPKLAPSRTNGTGLNNLQSRFQLLMEQSIQVDNEGKWFVVKLPLN